MGAAAKTFAILMFLPPVLTFLCQAIGIAIGLETGAIGFNLFKGDATFTMILNAGYMYGLLGSIIGSPICLILTVLCSLMGIATGGINAKQHYSKPAGLPTSRKLRDSCEPRKNWIPVSTRNIFQVHSIEETNSRSGARLKHPRTRSRSVCTFDTAFYSDFIALTAVRWSLTVPLTSKYRQLRDTGNETFRDGVGQFFAKKSTSNRTQTIRPVIPATIISVVIPFTTTGTSSSSGAGFLSGSSGFSDP